MKMELAAIPRWAMRGEQAPVPLRNRPLGRGPWTKMCTVGGNLSLLCLSSSKVSHGRPGAPRSRELQGAQLRGAANVHSLGRRGQRRRRQSRSKERSGGGGHCWNEGPEALGARKADLPKVVTPKPEVQEATRHPWD